MTYNPVEYWTERGKTYYDNFKPDGKFRLQESVLLQHLQKLQFESVLEVGCGFGRMTALLCEHFRISEYRAIDLSPDQIARAKEYVRAPVAFEISTIQELQAKQYDLVLASEVLLHVLPSEIEVVITKLLSLAKRHLVHIDPMMKVEKLAPHNFMHAYPAIYRRVASVAKVTFVPVGDIGQYVIHAEK